MHIQEAVFQRTAATVGTIFYKHNVPVVIVEFGYCNLHAGIV